jgi:hypothetical protein
MKSGPFMRYDDGTGSVEVERVDRRCSLFVARGHLSAELGRNINAEGTRIAHAGRAIALHDWSAVTGYDSAARQLCTEFMLQHRNDFESVTILLSSGLVTMGVQVANIVLRGFLHATSDRVAYRASIDTLRASRNRSGDL